MISKANKYVDEYLERMLKREFEAGNKSALLDGLYACLELKRPIPKWLQVAFLNAFEAVERLEIRSWDEVFDAPVPRYTHLKSKKRKAELLPLIIARVEAALKAKRAVDKSLFAQIGKELGIGGGTTTSNIYYRSRRKLRKG
jgi:hypothetical protein